MTDSITIAILAGGDSTRMGEDKARLEIEGETLLERTARIARTVSDDVVVIGRRPPNEWQTQGVAFLPDEEPGLGPIGGLKTALSHGSDDVMLLSCDLPFLSSEMLEWLLSSARRFPDRAAVVSHIREQIHPLLGIYRPAIREIVVDRIAREQRGMIALLEHTNVAFEQIPAHLERCATNVNTSAEWENVTRTKNRGT